MNTKKGHSVAQRPAAFRLAHPIAFAVMLLMLPALTVLTAFGVAPGVAPDDTTRKSVEQEVALSDWAPAAPAPQAYVTQEQVLRGDTVAVLFDRLGVHDARALDFLRADATGRTIFRQLVPGKVMQAQTLADGELESLRYFTSPGSLLEVRRTPDGFESRQRAITEAPRLVYKTGTI